LQRRQLGKCNEQRAGDQASASSTLPEPADPHRFCWDLFCDRGRGGRLCRRLVGNERDPLDQVQARTAQQSMNNRLGQP